MTMRVVQALVAAACVLCGTLAHAQGARSQFNGTVTDSGGGVLVGATVVATNVETNVESKVTTTDAGVYVIPYLANGVYKISVSAPGFRPAESTDVTLRAAQTLDPRLQARRRCDPGSPDRRRRRSSRPARLRSANTSRTRNSRRGRLPLATGSGRFSSSSFSSLPGTTGSTFEGAINGGRNYSHEILIEGMPLGRNLQGGSNNEMSPPTEAIEEFKFQTGTLGAEYRRRPDGGRQLRRQIRDEPVPRIGCGVPDGRTSGTRDRSSPRPSTRPRPCASSRMAQWRSAGRSSSRNSSTAATAASSSPRSRRRGRESRRPPRSAPCPPASSRTATSLGSSTPATPEMRDRARSSAPMPSAAIFASARSTTRARPAW